MHPWFERQQSRKSWTRKEVIKIQRRQMTACTQPSRSFFFLRQRSTFNNKNLKSDKRLKERQEEDVGRNRSADVLRIRRGREDKNRGVAGRCDVAKWVGVETKTKNLFVLFAFFAWNESHYKLHEAERNPASSALQVRFARFSSRVSLSDIRRTSGLTCWQEFSVSYRSNTYPLLEFY